MLKNEFYRIAYEFHKRWTPFPADMAGWEQMGNEACKICFERGNDPFLIDLMVAVMNDVGNEYEKSKEGVTDG